MAQELWPYKFETKLKKHNLMRGLLEISFNDNRLWEACVKGKQVKVLF